MGLFSSESIEIFDEVLHFFAKPIAKGSTGEQKSAKDHEKILDYERDKPEVQVLRRAQNSRVKDLLDMLLLKKLRPINRERFKSALQKIYSIRGMHAISENFGPPPSSWQSVYINLASECALSLSMDEAYIELKEFYQSYVLEN